MAETQQKTPQRAGSIPTATLKMWLGKVNKNEALDLDSFKQICEAVQATFAAESSLLQLTAPLVAVGDIHGQFDTLQEVLRRAGSPEKTKYVFMGDIVDRGTDSVTCIQLVFLLKLLHPANVYLLRGNHEDREVSKVYGFMEDLIKKYTAVVSVEIHEICCSVFDHLPIAAVVNKKNLIVHGGLSPSIATLDQIANMKRGEAVPHHGPLTDLLWNDPSEETTIFDASPRGAGFLWGAVVTKTFCNANKIDLIIRSHQLKNVGFEYNHDGLVLTVFTANNYSGRCGNDGAFVMLDTDLKREITIIPSGIDPVETTEATSHC